LLEKLWNLFRPTRSPAETIVPPEPPSLAPASPSAPRAPSCEQDDEAWERYENRETEGEYSWTYDGTTARYRDSSWQFHEPDTYRPKKVDERFYNELSPDHVNRLLSKKHLEKAAYVAYMRRKHSDEARALADLLTRQCIETYRKRCSGLVFQWRAKLLIEQGLAANAIELLTQRLEICQNEAERELLLKALGRAERKGRA